ncbi:MAG TPA: hypothetical protein VIZ63_23555 [Povalibacter sp.]
MNRVFTWKSWSVAVGVVLAAAFACLASGNSDMASALFVLAAIEGALGAIIVGVVRSRQKEGHPTAL